MAGSMAVDLAGDSVQTPAVLMAERTAGKTAGHWVASWAVLKDAWRVDSKVEQKACFEVAMTAAR
jgi:hypothetical protein